MGGTVLVTGAARGIGRGIAVAFADAGWQVVASDLAPLAGTMGLLGTRGAAVSGDIADLDGHETLLDRAFTCFGRLDALVNNAGISVRHRGDMLDVTPAVFDHVLGVNLRGTFFLTQALARRWVANPGPARTVITISSANATLVAPDRAEYCLSKTALTMMTRLFAVRLAEAGIAVFEVRPGIIQTDMTAIARARYDPLIAEGLTPIRRWGQPADVAAACVALAGDGFRFSTGDVVHVDGGLHITKL